jgi:hypothetical protein
MRSLGNNPVSPANHVAGTRRGRRNVVCQPAQPGAGQRGRLGRSVGTNADGHIGLEVTVMTSPILPPASQLTGEDIVLIVIAILTLVILFLFLTIDRAKKKKKRVAADRASEESEIASPMSEREEARLDVEILKRSREYLRECRHSRRRNK